MDPHCFNACFNGDPDQAFNLIADPDPDPGSQTNAEPDPGLTLRAKKVYFSIKNIIKVANRKPC